MRKSFWCSLGALLLAAPAQAQSMAGVWQGVEAEPGQAANWPTVLRVQAGKGQELFGVLYQEVGGEPETSATFQMLGARTATGLQLDHVRKLAETRPYGRGYWCQGSITFTYDASQEKLTGHATYRPVGSCDVGTFEFYRIKLKSAAKVPKATLSTLRVSGRDVRWFADPALRQPVATGNSFRTKLSKTTTFYLTQAFYATAENPVVPITIQVAGSPAPKKAPLPPPAPPAPPASAPALVVLPTVLFSQATAELLPESAPALDRLAADLQAAPQLRLRVAGHTDRLGEADKNLLLSKQRAEAVKAYLVKTGVAAGRIETIGYGDTRPLYPSPDARNRRVEVEKRP